MAASAFAAPVPAAGRDGHRTLLIPPGEDGALTAAAVCERVENRTDAPALRRVIVAPGYLPSGAPRGTTLLAPAALAVMPAPRLAALLGGEGSVSVTALPQHPVPSDADRLARLAELLPHIGEPRLWVVALHDPMIAAPA